MSWKKLLLKSSVPLEYEAATILSRAGFGVSADFAYSRLDSAVDKEFSVDVRGFQTIRVTESVTVFSSLDVLVECKFRDRGTLWLFLPKPDAQFATMSDVVSTIDHFSSKFVHLADDGERLSLGFTAVEIRVMEGGDGGGGNRTTESQLRHGLRQLQYALPALIALRIRSTARRSADDNFPFFVAPILLTNATLRIATSDFSVASVEAAALPDDLGDEVPYLVWSAELGPDFDAHCQRQFASLAELCATDELRVIEKRRELAGSSRSVLPSMLAKRIHADGRDALELADYSSVLVVNVKALPEIVRRLNESFERMVGSFKEDPVVRWTTEGKAIFPWE